MSEKLTQAEADELLNMLKYSLINEINFPEKGNSTEFNVKGVYIQRSICNKNISW